MISFGHTAVGVMIGIGTYQYLGQGDLATGLIITGSASFVSHYIMDAIPHGHFLMSYADKKSILRIIIFDVFLSMAIFLGAVYLKNGFGDKFLYAMFGIGGSQLPDVIDGLIFTKVIKAQGLLKVENKIHESLHWHGRGNKTLQMGFRDIWQVLVILTSLLLVIFS